MTRSERSANEVVADALLLLALSEGLLEAYLERVNELRSQLQALLLELPSDRAMSASITAATIAEAESLIEELFAQLAERFTDDMEVVAAVEHDRQKLVLLLFGATASAAFDSRAVALKPIAGVTIADAMRRIGDSVAYQFHGMMQRSFALGQSGPQAAAQIDGGGPLQEPTLFGPVQRQLEVLVRTQVAGVAEMARHATAYSPTEKPSPGWQHISVLDGRTSSVCLARAFKVWTAEGQPVGHSLVFAEPPLHPNCRSRLALVDIGEPVELFTAQQWAERTGTTRLVRLFGQDRVAQWQRSGITADELVRGRVAITLEEFKLASEALKP